MMPGRPGFHRRLIFEIPAEVELYEKLKAYQWNASTDSIGRGRSGTIRRRRTRPSADAPRATSSTVQCAEWRAFTFTQLFLGEQAALALCAQLLTMVPETETKFRLAGQIIDEARHVEVFGRYLDKLGVEAPFNPPLEELIHRLLESDHYGEKIVGMQIFLEGIAVGLFQRFQRESPDPLMRDLISLVLRDESRHAGFGVIYLANRFHDVSAAERGRIEAFVGDLWWLFHHATASPFGGVNEFLADTFVDIRHRLQRIGLELH
jgi:hypothetical protein